MGKREINNISDAQKRLKEIRPIGLDLENRQEMPFDHCDLYLLFNFIVNKLESLEKDNEKIRQWINALAAKTGRRFDVIEKGDIE